MRTAELTLPPTDQPELLPPGTRVDVRNRLDGRWAKGFEVLESTDAGYRLLRTSDGCTLPMVFSADDVRTERRKSANWWY